MCQTVDRFEPVKDLELIPNLKECRKVDIFELQLEVTQTKETGEATCDQLTIL